VNAVTDVVHMASPHLAAAELQPAFAHLRRSACWGALDEPQRLRIELLEAINARDAAAIAQRAVRLLDVPGVADRERASFLVSAVAASTALGERERARDLVKRYAPSISSVERERLLVRTAFANAFEPAR
jgi:hypothetical protein